MIIPFHQVLRWRRHPLEAGARWATISTALWVFAVPAAILLLRVSPDSAARLRLAYLGSISVLLGVFRPRLFWCSEILEGWRWAFGDRGVAVMYVGLGMAFIAVAFS